MLKGLEYVWAYIAVKLQPAESGIDVTSHKFTKLGTPHSEANRHNELIMAILERVRQTRVRRHAQRQIPFTCIKRGDPLREAEGNCTQETRVFCTQGQVPHRTHRTNEYPVMAM